MERPLAVTGFAYLSALAVALFVGVEYGTVLFVVLMIGFILSLFSKTLRKKAVIPTVLLTSAAAVLMLLGYSNAKVKPIEPLKGETAEITAQICDLPYCQNDRYYYSLEILSVKNRTVPTDTKIIVSSKNALNAEPYDQIKAKVKFYADTDDTYKAYNIARNRMLYGSFDTKTEPKITHTDKKPLPYYALMIRKTMTDRVKDCLPPEQSGFVNALLTGDQTGITAEQKDNFRAAGISHIIVVSGFHLSVLSQMIMAVLCFLMNKRKRPAALISAVFVFLYMAVVGFSPSVVRAGIMQILFLFGTACIRNADSVNSLAVAAFVICFIHPYAAGDVGFLLSFTASLGIILISQKIAVYLKEHMQPRDDLSEPKQIHFRKFIKPLADGIISITAVTVAASVFTLPIMILYFKQLSVYAVLSNIMVSFVVSVLIVCAVIMLICSVSIVSFLVAPLAFLCAVLTDYILWAADFVASLPFSTIAVSQSFVPFWLALIILLSAFLLMFQNRKRAVKYYALVAVLTLVIGFVSDSIVKYDSVKFSVLDTGGGLSVIMTKNGKTSVLYCGGSYDRSNVITEYLKNSAVTEIHFLVLTDKKGKNTQYAETILKNYPIKTVEAYDEKSQSKTIRSLIQNSDDLILPSSDTQPLNQFHTGNDEIFTYKDKKSNAVLIKANGSKVLICPDGTDCSRLPEEFLKCEFLIVGGGIRHSDLINAKYIIISDTQENLPDYGSYAESPNRHIYATADRGNLALRIYSGGTISIRRENGWLS